MDDFNSRPRMRANPATAPSGAAKPLFQLPPSHEGEHVQHARAKIDVHFNSRPRMRANMAKIAQALNYSENFNSRPRMRANVS